MADMGPSPRHATRGRPRSAEADVAILAATLELADEVGINGLSMDELANRAGVSKATIYRRWRSKEELVLAALKSAMSPFDEPDTGKVRSDLSAYLTELADRFTVHTTSDVLPHLITAGFHDEAIQASLAEYVSNRRGPLQRILERAITRNELAADTDIDVLIDLFIAPFMYRHLLSRAPIDTDFVDRLLDTVLGPPPATPPQSKSS